MKVVKSIVVMVAAVLSFGSFPVFAGQDHSGLINGPFKDGPSVTKACLECHEQQAADFMKTSHWTWQGPTKGHVHGYEHSKVEYGKTNMINGFCVNVEGGPNQSNRGHCGECHPSYFWKNSKFDLHDSSKVDCLICHAQKGDYGREDCEISDFTDLTKAARSVALPTLKNCGACHYAGGGDDGVKHGTLDSALNNADRSLDVHMAAKAKGGQGFTCQTCHVTKNHSISGASTQMATFDGRVNCEDCHSGKNAPHQKSRNGVIINIHLQAVACQTCHIPSYGRGKPTKMSWDYSTVGKGLKTPPMAGKPTFEDGRGSSTWARNVTPIYRWYDGTINRYMKGDKIVDMKAPVVLEAPYGSIQLKAAKIYPFKEYRSVQPADSKFGYLLPFSNYKGLWEHKDWNRALKEGAEGSGLPFSGTYQFVKTVSYIGQTHEVAPKEDALTCGDCHLGGGRMNWKELGYKGDPIMMGSGRFKDGTMARNLNPENLNFIQKNWVAEHAPVPVKQEKKDNPPKR